MKDLGLKWFNRKYHRISLLVALLVVLSACGGSSIATEAPEDGTAIGTPVSANTTTPVATVVPIQPSASSTPAIEPSPEPSPESEEGSQAAISDGLPDDPTELMLSTLDGKLDVAAQKMASSGNKSYIPVLLEFLRFQQSPESHRDMVGYINTIFEGSDSVAVPIERNSWGWWIEWLGNHPEIQPPDGFADWKGRLYSFLDPSFLNFLYDGVKTRIRLEEVVWGGVRKDGIPDLINPPVVSADDADYLEPSDRVFGVSFNGESRAYPLRILNPHEMANDVVGGVHFALAY